jgi:hypothetical protein
MKCCNISRNGFCCNRAAIGKESEKRFDSFYVFFTLKTYNLFMYIFNDVSYKNDLK